MSILGSSAYLSETTIPQMTKACICKKDPLKVQNLPMNFNIRVWEFIDTGFQSPTTSKH